MPRTYFIETQDLDEIRVPPKGQSFVLSMLVPIFELCQSIYL